MPRHRKPKAVKGEGLLDIFQPRNGYNNTSRRTLEDLGDATITGMTLSRAPIRRMLRRALDMLTLGKFEQAVKRFGYDRLFHLSVILDLDKNGVRRRAVVEKNAVINISTAIVNEADAEYLPIPLANSLTLRQLMDATQQHMGARFFPYNPWDNNCQHFIQAMLRANGLLTPEADKWLFQDMSHVQEQLPGASKALATGITRLGAVADRLLGRGMADREMDAVIRLVLDDLHQISSHKA